MVKIGHRRGFTVVELLIVIVVIAVLASLVYTGFRGVKNRGEISAFQANFNQLSKALELDRNDTGSYPASLGGTKYGQAALKSDKFSYQYTLTGSGQAATYCLTASTDTTSYHITSDNPTQMVSDVCAGHKHPLTEAPQIAYTYTGNFNVTAGTPIQIPINFALQPDDFIFVLFNNDYETYVDTISIAGTPLPFVYSKSTGASGYRQIIAHKGSGFTGSQTIDLVTRWVYAGAYATRGSFFVYVIRGLGGTPTIAATDTSFGSQSAGTTVSLPGQSVSKFDLAIFTYVFYTGGTLPTLSDGSQPSLVWSTDSTMTTPLYPDTVAAYHAVATGGGTVTPLWNIPNPGGYGGATVFTLKP